MKVLNRRIGWGPRGISYEADTKHIPAMLKAHNMEHCKSLNTPGAKKDEIKSNMQNEIEMENWAATKFRAGVATCNYLSADRPDIQFATKECSKRMAKLVQADWDMFKHLLRYLAGSQEDCSVGLGHVRELCSGSGGGPAGRDFYEDTPTATGRDVG